MFRKTPLDQTAEQGGGVAVLRAAGLVGQEDFMSCDLLNDIEIYFLCSFYDSLFRISVQRDAFYATWLCTT
jgi:hypothetical protein